MLHRLFLMVITHDLIVSQYKGGSLLNTKGKTKVRLVTWQQTKGNKRTEEKFGHTPETSQ